MKITRITSNKKRYLDLLLLADEQEDMIDRYLDRGDMYLLTCDGQPAAQCVVTDEGEGLLELKSLSVDPRFQGRGFGKALISFIERNYRSSHNALQVGTGDVPSTVGFYKHCGFALSHRVANFFIDNYDHAIIEDGRQLIDMVYLQKSLVATTKEELLRQEESRDLLVCGRPLSACADDGCWDDSIRADYCAHEPTPTPYFILEDLFSRIHLDEDSHLLDVGCGAGRVLAYAVEAGLPGHFTGVELDPALAARAQSWTGPFDQVDVVCGSALDMPLESFTHFYLFNPFDNNVLLAFLDKLEARARRRVVLVHMSDNGENYSYMGRPGWTLREQGEFWRYPHGDKRGFTMFGRPQHYSIWCFDPARTE